MQQLIDRFLEYVKIDTQSDPNSDTTPSPEKQWNLANIKHYEIEQLIKATN